MNETEKVTQWVEYKIGKLLTENIRENVDSESSPFNVDDYARIVFETYFSQDSDMKNLKSEISSDPFKLNFDSDDFCLTETFSQGSSDDDQFDFQPPSLDAIISDLQNPSEEVQMRALESLEASSAEELVVQTSWTIARKILQDMIKMPRSERVSTQVLELFRRFLRANDTPRVVCEGFVSLSESVAFHIEAINTRRHSEPRTYDFKKGKWLKSNSGANAEVERRKDAADLRLIFKSMWLLVESQKGIPLKWNRFNEKRLREIVFSFIHMLSLSTNLKNKDWICGLEILSVLDPKASWCNNWCHGATGRSLLCSALKTHKQLLNEIVDFILLKITNKESSKPRPSRLKLPPLNEVQPRTKGDNTATLRPKDKYSARLSVKDREGSKSTHSAPPFPSDENRYKDRGKGTANSDWLVKGIPRDVANEAKFCHCVSMAVYLIRYRGGRSMFPLQVASRRRRMTIPDFTQTVLNHINATVFLSGRNEFLTEEYKQHMLKLVEIIKSM